MLIKSKHIVATVMVLLFPSKLTVLEKMKIVFLMLLLGGDDGLVPAAFPQALGCDGGVNLLLAPIDYSYCYVLTSYCSRQLATASSLL